VINVKFEFFDMKYLSNSKKFYTRDLKYSEVTADGVTGTIDIDFSVLEESDSSKGTKFVVGGRTYFEASAFGTGVGTFTTKGFFDKKDYNEPSNGNLKDNKALLWVTIVLSIVGFTVFVVVIYCCCCKKKSNVEDDEKVHYD
jgi:hypothetical protein